MRAPGEEKSVTKKREKRRENEKRKEEDQSGSHRPPAAFYMHKWPELSSGVQNGQDLVGAAKDVPWYNTVWMFPVRVPGTTIYYTHNTRVQVYFILQYVRTFVIIPVMYQMVCQ